MPGGAEAKRRTARNAVWEIRAAAGSQTLFDCDWSCADNIAALQRAAAAFLPANLAAQLAPLLARQLPPAVPGPAPAPEAAVRQALGAPVPLESARGAAAAAGGPAAGATQVGCLTKWRALENSELKLSLVLGGPKACCCCWCACVHCHLASLQTLPPRRPCSCAYLRCPHALPASQDDLAAAGKKCGGCHAVRFCCRDCQVATWPAAACKALRGAGGGARGGGRA